MDRQKIAGIYEDASSFDGKKITVCGWARTIRDLKNFGFIALNDGSCFKPLQVVLREIHWKTMMRSQSRTSVRR